MDRGLSSSHSLSSRRVVKRFVRTSWVCRGASATEERVSSPCGELVGSVSTESWRQASGCDFTRVARGPGGNRYHPFRPNADLGTFSADTAGSNRGHVAHEVRASRSSATRRAWEGSGRFAPALRRAAITRRESGPLAPGCAHGPVPLGTKPRRAWRNGVHHARPILGTALCRGPFNARAAGLGL